MQVTDKNQMLNPERKNNSGKNLDRIFFDGIASELK